jgi:acetyltransferase-like isoleucine patch superfamily enzyme
MFHLETKTGEKLTFKKALPKIINRLCNYYLDFELMLLSLVGLIPFHSLRRFFCRLAGVKIGKGSTIHMEARFYQPNNIIIGEDTIIGDHCFLDGRASLKIGSHTAIASYVLIYNSEHDINSLDFRPIEEPVEIGDFCFIGARAIILPGVKIGKGAVVASGAVVTKDVPSLSIVGGVPAREIGKRRIKIFSYRLGRARLFQ